MIGKLKIPNSPSSSVKNPKKLIFIDDKTSTVNGNINDTKINIRLTLLSHNFCNSNLIRRSIGFDWFYFDIRTIETVF